MNDNELKILDKSTRKLTKIHKAFNINADYTTIN